MSLRNRFGAFFFALTFVTACAYSFAEQSTTDSPCATPDARSPVLESFSMVHLTALNAITSTIAPVLPGEVLGALFLQDGTPNPDTQVRNRLTYDRKERKFTNKLFLVIKDVEETDPFAFIEVRVNKVDTLCRSDTGTPNATATPPVDPRDLGRWVSVLLQGKILNGVAVFGNPGKPEGDDGKPEGDDYTFSFAYTVDPGDPSEYGTMQAPGKCSDGTNVFDHPFRDLNSVDSGRASDYRDCADGSITFKAHP